MKRLEPRTAEHLEKYMGLLTKWASIYKNYNLGDFDDMLQDAMMVYLDACDTYNKTKAKFGTYLYSRLRFELLNKLEKRKTEPHVVSLDNYMSVDGEPFLDKLPSEHILLDDRYPIINMRYMGMTMEEIAEVMGISRRTAYNMWNEERKNFTVGR